MVNPARSNRKRSGRDRATSAFHSRFRSVTWRSPVPSARHTKSSEGDMSSVATKAMSVPSPEAEKAVT